MRLCETKTFNLPESTPVNSSQLQLLTETFWIWNYENLNFFVNSKLEWAFFQAISRLGIILNLEQQCSRVKRWCSSGLGGSSASPSRSISYSPFQQTTLVTGREMYFTFTFQKDTLVTGKEVYFSLSQVLEIYSKLSLSLPTKRNID